MEHDPQWTRRLNTGCSGVNGLMPYGDYMWVTKDEWENHTPPRVKQILSVQCLQVWNTIFAPRVGEMKLPEAFWHSALSHQDRWEFTNVLVNTQTHLETEHDHDICCPQSADDLFLTREFEKALLERKLLRLTTELKVLKLKEKTRREIEIVK
jgi:hypothetical protein